MNPAPNYVVVTPARNEQENIPHTIKSMLAQTVRPHRWVIVNDGSKDRTGAIIDAASAEHPWIVARHRPDRGGRKQGGGVVDTFYDGYGLVSGEPWEFVVKFDADLSFVPNYFERCLAKFVEDPQLGIGGGVISNEIEGRLVIEAPRDPLFHVRGATKIYRRSCWEAIGGLIRSAGWDTVDELKANMMGYRSLTFRDIPVKHHRLTGTADGAWKDSVKNGHGAYVTGYHPLFMLVKCISRIPRHPFMIRSTGLWWGFCRGYLSGEKQIEDRELIRYIRKQQMNKLMLRPSLW